MRMLTARYIMNASFGIGLPRLCGSGCVNAIPMSMTPRLLGFCLPASCPDLTNIAPIIFRRKNMHTRTLCSRLCGDEMLFCAEERAHAASSANFLTAWSSASRVTSSIVRLTSTLMTSCSSFVGGSRISNWLRTIVAPM